MKASIRFAASLWLSCLLAIAACQSSIKKWHDSDPDADFSAYHTYAWLSDDPLIQPAEGITQGPYVSPIDEKRIRQAVDTVLAGKGYRKAPLAQADLVVSFSIGAEEKIRVQESPGRGAVYRRGYGYGTWYGASSVRVQTFTQGTLAIEFFDRESRQAVWVGWGSKRVSEMEDREETIWHAVGEILTPFPRRF